MSEKLVEIKDLEISSVKEVRSLSQLKMLTSLSTREKPSHLLVSQVVGKQLLVVLSSVSMIQVMEISFLKVKRLMGKKSREQAAELIRRIQMIFQDPAASLNERATVDYIISEGLYNHRLFKDEEERKEKVKKYHP